MKFSRNRKIAAHCPCGKSNANLKFAPYENLPNFGYCHSCAKTFSPDNSTIEPPSKYKQPSNLPTYIDDNYLDLSIQAAINRPNYFLRYITSRYGLEQSQIIQKRFLIGNSSRWDNCCVFWQVDKELKVRSGKVLLYCPHTGKRQKDKNDWIHSILVRKKHLNDFS